MSVSKVITMDLQADVVGAYEEDKTTIEGLVTQKVLSGVPCIGAPMVKSLDIFSLAGITALRTITGTSGAVYAITAPVAGLTTVARFPYNSTTQEWEYDGKILLSLPNTPATTHTLRDGRVDDTVSSNIQIWLTTVATVATQNGGLFRAYKIDVSDFALSPPTIAMATASDSKAVYYHQDPSFMGVLNTSANSSPTATIIGLGYKPATKKVWTPNGSTATATWSVTEWDFSAAPTIVNSGSIVVTAASPAVATWTAHGLTNNDCIRFISGTLPTGLSLNTDYFVRNATANDFELSLTSGGVSINTTGSNGSAVAVRSFGITTSGWSHKTSVLPTTGLTALLTGAVKWITPVSGHAANNGVECLLIGCSAGALALPISEITSGATNIPNLLNVNLLGSTSEITAPTAVNATWSSYFDRLLYIIGGSILVGKKLVNNQIQNKYGVDNNDYLEGLVSPVTQFGMAAVTSLDSENGWVHIVGSTTGQRVMLSLNNGSDSTIGTAKIITKVLDIKDVESYVGFASALNLGDKCAPLVYYYRTNLNCDFTDATTGWQGPLLNTGLMNAISSAGVNKIQFKLQFNTVDQFLSNPAQIIEMFFAYNQKAAVSANWRISKNLSTDSTTVFYLKTTYTGSVPNLSNTAYDLSGALLYNYTTAGNAAQYAYSTDGGVIWNALGTIPNTAGTLLRVTWSPTPVTTIEPGIGEV